MTQPDPSESLEAMVRAKIDWTKRESSLGIHRAVTGGVDGATDDDMTGYLLALVNALSDIGLRLAIEVDQLRRTVAEMKGDM